LFSKGWTRQKQALERGIAVLFTSIINKLTRDEARGIDDARPAPGINTEKRQGFRRQLQGSDGHKESQYLFLSSRNSFHSQKPNLLLAQSTNTTHRHSNSLSWTRACDRSPPSTPELLPASFTVHQQPPCLPRNRGQSGQKINRFPSSKFHQPGHQLQRSSIGLRGSLRHLRELIIISLLSKHPLLFVPLHLSLSVHSLKDLTALLSGIPATRTWLKTLKTLKTLIRMVVLVLL
jgi:hypothetical protein